MPLVLTVKKNHFDPHKVLDRSRQFAPGLRSAQQRNRHGLYNKFVIFIYYAEHTSQLPLN